MTRWLLVILFAVAAAADPVSAAGWMDAWRRSGQAVGPEVREAWLAERAAATLAELRAAGFELPPEFLAWVDSDPLVRATVYAARRRPADVLRMLRSLELDLGADVVRRDYTQLALAMAVVHADKAAEADLRDRGPFELVIPGDPRVPVDTKDPGRTLDRDDHIINFLESRTIEEEIVVGQKEEDPPLRYDDRGIPIPPPKNAPQVKVPVTEKRTRTLHAADVMASRPLQEEFNASMRAHGQDVSIDCGDNVIHWKSKAAVRAERKSINEAFVMFRTAYERTGRLPAARDPAPSPAAAAAWLIRNDRFRFPPEMAKQRQWPRYPLQAPWPTLTLLAVDSTPLREREDRWLAFRDRGEFRTYGEYIGPIAQQFDMQSARRLTPFPFTYGSYQMMAKDGGVCGTMAKMAVRSCTALGIPASTAAQPGHCAYVFFAHDAKTGMYDCKGGQFATGGPARTNPHAPWMFGEVNARRPMIYHQTIAWAMNFGVQSYLDATIALRMFEELPADARARDGIRLLEGGLVLNPYNILLVDAAQETIPSVVGQAAFQDWFQRTLATVAKLGCPTTGLYPETVGGRFFVRVAKLPVPTDREEARRVLASLRTAGCTHGPTLAAYRIAVDGLEGVMEEVAAEFQEHVAGTRTPDSCHVFATLIDAVGKRVADGEHGRAWLAGLANTIRDRATYQPPKSKPLTDPCEATIAALITAAG
jgi:hypothetical protein